MEGLITKNKLGRTGLDISRVAYGGIISMNEQQSDSDRYVAYAVDKGINYFDVAPSYGNAQEILGKSLVPYRNDIYLACKTGEFGMKEGMEQFNSSLKMLHTDHFDVYQLHGLTEMSQLERVFAPDGIMGFLVRAKKEGLIRNIGFSAHSEAVALKALERYDFDTVLFPFNWSLHMAKGAGSRILAAAKERNMGILALKAMAHRAWKPDEFHDHPKCWYKPIDPDNTELLTAAANYTLSLGVHTFIPPGEFAYLRFAAEHFESIDDPGMNARSEELLRKALQDGFGFIFDQI